MSSQDNEPNDPTEKRSGMMRFFYEKSRHFQSIHVDGAIGGLSPRGYIHMAIFTERTAIPRILEVALTEDGKLAKEVRREGKEGIFREMQCDLVLDLDAAKNMLKWLKTNISALEAALPKTAKEEDHGNS